MTTVILNTIVNQYTVTDHRLSAKRILSVIRSGFEFEVTRSGVAANRVVKHTWLAGKLSFTPAEKFNDGELITVIIRSK